MNILFVEDTKEIFDNIKKLLQMYDKTYIVYQAFD
jgi:DNA-binding response OmpR family regulator